jgi:uncharacterized protein YutE (UPF0331/DUF86 family)
MPVDEDILRTRISEVRSAVNELKRLAYKEFRNLSLDERYSMRYNMVILVEAIVSLCLHIIVEAYGETPRSYREAVRAVAERLSIPCADELEDMVGLRNLLIHRYWTVDDERLYENVKEDFKCVEELLRRVEEAFLG